MKYLFLILLSGCAWNVPDVKIHAKSTFEQSGYQIVGYEGYQMSCMGGYVWYNLKREDSPGIIYEAALAKWGSEYHIYNLTVVSGNQLNILNGSKNGQK